MSKAPELHFIVEGGAVLAACRDWRDRYQAACAAAADYAKGLGSSAFCVPILSETLGVLAAADPIPGGWRRVASRRAGAAPLMVPLKRAEGAAAREALAALPKFPLQAEIAEAIGHPGTIRWRVSGEAYGSRIIGNRMEPVQLYWPASELLLIVCGDPAHAVRDARLENPGCVIEHGEWTPPSGLRALTEAQRDLLVAQARVNEEARDSLAA